MSAIWRDIKDALSVHYSDGRRERHRYCGYDPLPYNEILYADDTILLGRNTSEITLTLQLIQTESAKYGLNLNKGKCEHIQQNTADPILFEDGKAVKQSRKPSIYECSYTTKLTPM